MSAKQMAITTVAVMALVVIVTLVKVGLGGRADANKGKQSDTMLNRPHLSVLKPTVPDDDPQNPTPPPYAEIHQEGHHDFWFTNDNDAPVDVFLQKVSCGRCVTMKIGLAPEGTQATDKTPESSPEVKWTTLESEEGKHDVPGFTVPAKAGGWLRLGWHDKDEMKQEPLTATLRTNCSTSKAPAIDLKVMVRFMPGGLPVEPKLVLNPILTGNDKPQTVWFQVISATRDRFQLDPLPEAEQKKRHPFVSCGQPVALGDTECRNLEKMLGVPVRSAYKVPVTVREKVDEREHDFGPFTETVALKSDALADDVKLTVTGSVEGLVSVLCGENKDNVALGAFHRSTGTQKTLVVKAVKPGADLSLTLDEDKLPDFLQVSPPKEVPPQTIRDGCKRWTVEVSVKVADLESANVFGSLEAAMPDPSVYLKVNGRRLRIPVSGTVQR